MNAEPRTEPAHNFTLEMSILAALMVGPEQIAQIAGRLDPAHFADQGHAAIYQEMATEHSEGRVADPVRLWMHFDGHPVIKHLGADFLEKLLSMGDPNAPYLGSWADALIATSVRRRGAIVLSEAVEIINNPDTDISKALHGYMHEIEALAGESSRATVIEYSEAVAETVAFVEKVVALEGAIVGLSTGYKELDTTLGGLHPGELYILGGRPSLGKSDLAWNIAENVASDGHTVVGFSLEMTYQQLVLRSVARRSSIPASVVRGGRLDPADLPRRRVGAEEVRDLPIHVNEDGGLSVAEMRSFAQRLDPALVVIDYVQLIRSAEADDRYRGEVERVSKISNALKAMAKALRCPVLAVAQLNRQVEQRDDKRPQLFDLKESGTIEQDADAVLFLYRDEYYLRRERPKDAGKEADWRALMADVKGKAEVIVAKQRMGPLRTILLKYVPAHSLFSDWPEEDMPAEFEGI